MPNLDPEQYDHTIITRTADFENITTQFCGSFEDAVAASRKLQNLVHGGEGISDNDFRDVVDKLVAGESVAGGVNLWENMSSYQKDVCQEIKRSKKRLDYRNNKEE